MRTMVVSKSTAVVNVVILCLFISFVGATELTSSKVTPSSLESSTGVGKECDCGPHGACKIEEGKKRCKCDVGFQPNDGFCEECDCGKQGWCVFNHTVKTCICRPYTVERDGICTDCTCFLPLKDGDKRLLECYLENGVEKCICPSGFTTENNNCIDIDECLDPTSCHNDTRCENFPGYYMCFCKAGYTGINDDPKTYGCRDIDECVEYNACRFNESTTCVNTDGDYYCECKPGYSANDRSQLLIRLMGCDKDGLGIGYIVLITVAAIVVVVVVGFAIKKVFFS